jgi:hypothetical protein
MRPVDARAINRPLPYHTRAQTRVLDNAGPYLLLCVFWGLILFLALNAALH